jgi:lipopolysaccharide/colanic/teichoic acid biosynthesis glycosyltransferase
LSASKRAVDLIGAAILLVITAPIVLVAAVAIFIEDRNSPLFRQRRVGYQSSDFDLLKLRTMIVGAEHQGAGYAVNAGDDRITRVGRILRRLSLDELPQLWNVMRGEMSLVGPRPTLRFQVERYTPRQLQRLDVKPGISGWAQINGRAALPWNERIELDIWYANHQSTWLDLRILARTPFVLFRGTYKGATGGWRSS